MPTYQYVCTECGEPLEVVQKFSDDPLTVCPACQGRLRKVFSPVGVVFKGSGFYKTDSRAKSSSSASSGSSSSSSDNSSGSSSSDSGATDKKTDKKAEPASAKPSSSTSSSPSGS